MSSKKLRPVFKMHGGKYYLANWIISHFPSNYTALNYGEPFVGAGSVFLNKKPSKQEWINDLHRGIVSIWLAMKDRPYEFLGRLTNLEYCEDSFNEALIAETTDLKGVDLALNEFVLRRMSRGGLKKAFGWSDRQRGGLPGDVNAWVTILEQLPAVIKRVANTWVTYHKAVDAIRGMSSSDTVIYCDPPYLPATRQSPSAYECDMAEEDHVELAEALNQFKGKVILSGYASPLYEELYDGWVQRKRLIANHASQQKKKQHKEECLWMNYEPDPSESK